LRIATRCTSIDQFVAAFHRFCDAQTCFISTLTARPVGLETAFSIDLANAQPALRGMGIVLEAWTTPGNRFGRPGLLLGIRKLTADSEGVFERLLAAHVAATPPPFLQQLPPPAPSQLAQPIALPNVLPDDTRTPGSELVLPANPLMNISDHSLEGFVDCTLYEETGNFFPAPEPEIDAANVDPLVEPPRRVTIPPIAEPRTMTGPMMSLPRTLTGPMTPIAIAMPPPMPPPMPLAMPMARPVVKRALERAASEPFVPVPSAPPMTVRPIRRGRITGIAAWPRQRIAVAGGVAVITIALAIVIASKSGHASHATATTDDADLVAANLPPPERRAATPSVPHPVPVADVAPLAGDDPGDASGGAPMFGSGPCKIAVSTTPAGSIISVDGEVAGPSPITIGGPCAKRKLDIAHPRYAPATRIVAATPDAAANIDVALARPTHDLYVETSPAGAAVSIDGHRAGTTPTLVKIMGFTALSLRIDKFGFKSTTQRIYSKSPHDRVTIKLGH
jgi:hypothetical protein